MLPEGLAALRDPAAPRELERAKQLASAAWMIEATTGQFEKLMALQAPA
jgi:hypothetical protein